MLRCPPIVASLLIAMVPIFGQTPVEMAHLTPTILPVSYVLAPAMNDSVAKYLAEAKRLGGLGFVDRAVEQYQKAISAEPRAWRHSYSLGEYLLANTERWSDTQNAFLDAWEKGHRRGITRHKIGITLYRQDHFSRALEEFNRSIEMNRAALATAAAKDAAHLRFQIADSYLWQSRVARDAGLPDRPVSEEMHRELIEAIRHNPTNRDLRLKILHLGHFLFGHGDFDDAFRLYQLAFHDTSTGKPKRDVSTSEYLDWGIDPGIMLDLAENRVRLGAVTPQYTHKVVVVFYHRIQQYKGSGWIGRVAEAVTETQKREASHKLKWLARVVESLSNGRLSLEVVQTADAAPDTGANHTSPGGTLGDSRVLAEKFNEFDAIVRVWPMAVRIRAWAEETYPDLRPIRSTSAFRGILNIGPDHPHGIWLHEFFHLLEMLAGIAPAHGYLDEARKQFPGWKGRTGNEMHYYRWHFQETIGKLGWESLNYRIRHPLR